MVLHFYRNFSPTVASSSFSTTGEKRLRSVCWVSFSIFLSLRICQCCRTSASSRTALVAFHPSGIFPTSNKRYIRWIRHSVSVGLGNANFACASRKSYKIDFDPWLSLNVTVRVASHWLWHLKSEKHSSLGWNDMHDVQDQIWVTLSRMKVRKVCFSIPYPTPPNQRTRIWQPFSCC